MRKVFRVSGLSAKMADCLGAKPKTVTPINAKGEPIVRRELCASKKRNRLECIALPVGVDHFRSPKPTIAVKRVVKQHRV